MEPKDVAAVATIEASARLSSRDRALRLPQVREMTGLGRSMIYQLQAEKRFPRRIKLGERSVGWLESEVREWLNERARCSR